MMAKQLNSALLAALVLLFLSSPSFCAEKPYAAVAPLELFGKTSQAEKKIIYNRFENRLSDHYRLLSRAQYRKARDQVFSTVESDQCTEKYCIRKIQEMLQVERLFFLEITAHQTITQLSITLVRVDDTLKEESVCQSCGIEALYRNIGTLVDRIAARDRNEDSGNGPTTDSGQQIDPHIKTPETAGSQKSGFLSRLTGREIAWHGAAIALIAASIWKSTSEADEYNKLADSNRAISTRAANAGTQSEYAALAAAYADNQDEMDQIKTSILIYDGITLLAVAWEGWQIHRSMANSVTFFADGSPGLESREGPTIRPVLNRLTGKAGLSFSWSW
ncbi:MAG: hypothetical protein ABIK68_00225 [bacterium]